MSRKMKDAEPWCDGGIEVKALGLVWRQGRLLASEIYSDDGSVKGVRPLGGRVELGERWQDALVREFREELGIAVEVAGEAMILENIYKHHGALGHEVVFVADVTAPAAFYEQPGPIAYQEDNGTPCIARWFYLADLDRGGLALYPAGLKPRLLAR